MKRTAKLITAILCLAALLVSSLCSCQPTPKNEEVENDSLWAFDSIGEVEIINENKSQSFIDSHLALVKSWYAVNYTTGGIVKTKSDVIAFKDGNVTKVHFGGSGDASYVNGISVYPGFTAYESEFGTYSGSDINIVDVNEEIVDAYIRDGVLILIHEDLTLRAEIRFTKTTQDAVTIQ